jgi:hypothetical protein
MNGNITAILFLALSLCFVGIGVMFFGQVTDATDEVLAYTYSGNGTITDASFTGLTSIIGMAPMLVFLGYLSVAVIGGFLGYKIFKGEKSGKMSPSGLILMGISIVFIGLGFRFIPIALDGFAYILHGGGSGINSAYTGLESIVKMGPMLLTLGYIAATVLSGFFGMKLSSSDNSDNSY